MVVIRATSAVIALLALAASASVAHAKPRVGFANVSVDGDAAADAIAALRQAVDAEGRFEEVAQGPARYALEEPVDPADTPEADAARRATTRLAGAREAFAAFEYDSAMDQLRQAEQVLRSVAPTAEVVKALADVSLMIGLVHASRQDELKALAAFRLVQRLDPTLTSLDRKQYRPQIVILFDRAIATDNAPQATLIVDTEPQAASVFLDGKNVATTPAKLPAVAAGEHYLTVTLDGHAPRTEKIKVAGDKPIELSLLLSRLPGEDRARALRTSLLRPEVTEADWANAASALADSASVDALVIVRDRDQGGLEAAVFTSRKAELGKWIAIGERDEILAALPRPAAPKIAVPAVTGPTLPESALRLRDDERRPKPNVPWYRTPWGTGAIIGGSVLVTAAVLVLLAPEPDSGALRRIGPTWTWAPP